MNLFKKPLLGLAAAAALLALPVTAQAAWHNAYATASVNMRAGPSTGYRVITTVPAGARVHVYGCRRGWNWCDTAWAGHRGWVSGSYLRVRYHNRWRALPSVGVVIGVPFIGWNEYEYWGNHYRHRPWYHHRHHHHRRYDHDRNRRDWQDRDRHHHNRPRVEHHNYQPSETHHRRHERNRPQMNMRTQHGSVSTRSEIRRGDHGRVKRGDHGQVYRKD